MEDLIVQVGEMSKGNAYESQRLFDFREDIRPIIGNRQVIGTYGQLSFASEESAADALQFFTQFMTKLKSEQYAILHSGSLLGIGGIAHKEAKKNNLLTLGIIPHSTQHITDLSEFSKVIVEGDDWGDASYLFGGLPDEIIFAGGGYWSYLEYQKAREFDKEIKFLNFKGARYAKEFDDVTRKETMGTF